MLRKHSLIASSRYERPVHPPELCGLFATDVRVLWQAGSITAQMPIRHGAIVVSNGVGLEGLRTERI